MDIFDIVLAAVFTFFAALGLLCTFLQKKGIIKPFVTQTSDGFHFVTTDGVTLLAILFGALMISRGSILFAVLYAALLGGAFFCIKCSGKRK